MDFFQINAKALKKDEGLTAYPDFIVGRSDDLMVRAKYFYAIWDEPNKIWSTDEYKVQELVDAELAKYKEANPDVTTVKWMRSFGSNGQTTFRKYVSSIGDHFHQLDENLTFLSTVTGKKDYVSKRLPYDLTPGDISGWTDLAGVLYKPTELQKIEWYIGAIISGEAKTIQKFLVLFGPPGAGKGTIIEIIEEMFPGYIATFKAKELGGGGQFASSAFASNPMVAIEHDGDMSRVEDNTLFNSIVSHESMTINEKYKAPYTAKINAALIVGTNKPVKITDAQSGLIRRLIDVHPSGEKLAPKPYWNARDRIAFQRGAIAQHCLDVYKKLGKHYYSNYQPLEMMFKTNAFFNFIQTYFETFEAENGITAKRAWSMYGEYCTEFEVEKKMSNYAFKNELGNYFEEFHDKWKLDDGTQVRNYYKGFKPELFKTPVDDSSHSFKLALTETVSLLNLELGEYPAQYANASGYPSKYWDDSEKLINGTLKRPRPSQIVSTLLRDLDPYLEHFVKVPENLICIDFDIRDENGEKSLEKNLEAAALWPATYGELSKSGKGVHLHYYYEGELDQLDPNYEDGIEVKVFRGNAALRRKLTKCNAVAIAILTASSGILPLKEKKRVLDVKQIQSVKGLRRQIDKALNREIHSSTKSNVDYIKQAVDDFYDSGMSYDITDLQGKIAAFAQSSSNQPIPALRVVKTIKWQSDDMVEPAKEELQPADDRLVIYDVEVYPNLFVVCWKFKEKPGEKPNKDNVIRMINPKPHEIEALFRLKLVGFFNRNYDNHILWGAFLGYDNAKLYQLSKRLINGSPGAKYPEAYNLSHSDILDFATKKESLKKWQVDLGLEHREMDIPWDKDVPEDKIMAVVEYCVNDVVSTESVLDHLNGDWKARLFLASLSGLSPNHTTQKHTAQIVFGPGFEKRPLQREFVYTDLSEMFPGYKYELGVSTYRGETVGEGGLVRSKPGIYKNVGLLDIASMHPTSIGQLNLFGDDYTPKYMALVDAQLALKRGDYTEAKDLLAGKLRPFIQEIEELQSKDPAAAKKAASDLRYGLKIAINIVYGLTSAKFDNPFRDRKNVDNIVAKRGALFMVDLMFALEEAGYELIHIKTDSVKIANITPEAIDFVQNFGAKYGYKFEHEATYEKFALFNDAVYIAKKNGCDISAHSYYDPKTACWTATGTQFIPEANPYVFKKLFGYEVKFDDLCVTKAVNKGKIYLDFGHHEGASKVEELMGWVEWAQAETKDLKKAGADEEQQKVPMQQVVDELVFVGKIGRFTPVVEGFGGGQLWRLQEDKAYAIPGTKGYLWVDSNVARDLPGDAIDYRYFEKLYDEAVADIEKLLPGTPFETVADFLS